MERSLHVGGVMNKCVNFKEENALSQETVYAKMEVHLLVTFPVKKDAQMEFVKMINVLYVYMVEYLHYVENLHQDHANIKIVEKENAL